MSGDTKTVPPVVGHRFRRRDGSIITITVALLIGTRVIYVGGGGEVYDDADTAWASGHDLIEDLGPAGGEA